MLPNFIFTEGCLPGGRAGAVGMLFLPRDSQLEADFRGAEPYSNIRLRTCALSFFPSKQAVVEILSRFHSQVVSCRKLSHSPFPPKQPICISAQTGIGDRIFGALTTPQPETWHSTAGAWSFAPLQEHLDPCPLTQTSLAPRGAAPMN